MYRQLIQNLSRLVWIFFILKIKSGIEFFKTVYRAKIRWNL